MAAAHKAQSYGRNPFGVGRTCAGKSSVQSQWPTWRADVEAGKTIGTLSFDRLPDQRLEDGSVGVLFQKSFKEKMTPSSFERVSSHC